MERATSFKGDVERAMSFRGGLERAKSFGGGIERALADAFEAGREPDDDDDDAQPQRSGVLRWLWSLFYAAEEEAEQLEKAAALRKLPAATVERLVKDEALLPGDVRDPRVRENPSRDPFSRKDVSGRARVGTSGRPDA